MPNINPVGEHALKTCCWGAATATSALGSTISAILTVVMPLIIIAALVSSWYFTATISPIDLVWMIPVDIVGGFLLVTGAGTGCLTLSQCCGRMMVESAEETSRHATATMRAIQA